MLLGTLPGIARAQPARPNYPTIANLPVFDIRASGAVPNDGLDDTAAINATIDKADAAGRGVVLIPAGEFTIVPSGTTTYLVAKSNVTLSGVGPASVLKVKNDAGNYERIGGSDSAVVNFRVENLTIDQNPVGNTTATIRTSTNSKQLNVFKFSNVQGLTFSNVRFDRLTGVWAVFVSGANCRDVVIDGCYGMFRQGVRDPADAAPFYDNTAFYLEAVNSRVTNNTLVVDETDGGYQTHFANGGVEIHGPGSVVSGNLFDGYMAAAHITTVTTLATPATYDITFSGNTVRRAAQGVTLIAAANLAAVPQTLRGVTVSGNTFNLHQADHDRSSSYGVGFSVAAATMAIEDSTITGNTIRFQTPDLRASSTVEGIALQSTQTGVSAIATGNIRNVKISGNTILNAPMWAVGVASASGVCERIDVTNNLLIDNGLNTAHPTQTNRAQVCLGGGAAGNLTDITVRHNILIDSGTPNLKGLSSVLSLNGAGTQTRIYISENSVRAASGQFYPMVVDNEAGISADAGLEVVTYAATITPIVHSGDTKYCTLTGNVIVNAPTGGAIRGKRLTFIFVQDGTGGRTVTWNAAFSGMTALTSAQSAAGGTAAWEVVYDGSAWKQVSTSISPVVGTAASRDVGIAVGNVPVVEAGGKLNASIIPATSKTWVVTDEAAMLALSSAVVGDYALQTASSPPNELFYLTALPPATLGNWAGPIATGVTVSSVNGFTGAVTLATANVAESGGGPLYYTTGRVNTDAPNVTLNAGADTLLGLSGQQLTLDPQSANTFLMGPTGGGAAVSTFRAPVLADLPSSVFGTGTTDATTFLRGDRTWQAIGAATTTASGLVELATLAESDAGTDTVRAVTPAGLVNRVFTSRTISTTAPLSGGGDLSANRTLSVAAASETATGVVELATVAEANTGTDTTRAVTPAGIAARIPASAFGAKGHLLVGTGAGTYTSVAPGTDGQVLHSASGTASGVQWNTDDVGGGGSTSITSRSTANQTFTSSTLADVSELTVTGLSSGTVYRFRSICYVTTNAATVGIHFGVGFTGTQSYFRVGHINPVAAPAAAGSAVAHGVATALNTKILATTAGPGATVDMVLIEGIIEVSGTGGDLSIQAASETGAAVVVQRGSYLVVDPF